MSGVRLATVFSTREDFTVITLSRWLCKIGLFLAPLLFAAGGLLAAPEWRVLETPRFDVVSQLSEKETRAWAEEFNQFIEALGGLLKVQERFLPKLTVVVFASEKAFRPYLPRRPDGKPAPVAGYFSRQETWAVIGMADRWGDEKTREIIFHEGVHWILSIYPRYLPLCLSEGLAEVYSTFRLEKGKARWGTSRDDHVGFLQYKRNGLLPIETLLHTSFGNSLFNENERTGLFYAESWVFVHYLMFGKHAGARSALVDFLEAYSKGDATSEAFQAAFGMDYVNMDKNLLKYLVGGKYFIRSVPVGAEKNPTGAFVVASAERVEMALAKLALSVDSNELARKHAEAAVKIAPENPACHDTLAFVQDKENPGVAGFDAAQRAVALGSKEAWTYMIVATGRIRAAMDLGGIPPNEARKIANHFEKAINLRPNLKPAYLQLADILEDVKNVTDEDERFIQQGMAIFPDELTLCIKMARLVHKRGDHSRAIGLLGRVYGNRDSSALVEIATARELEQSWTYDDFSGRMKACADAQKYEEAIAVIDEALRNDRLATASKAEFSKNKEMFVVLQRWKDVYQAMNEGRRDDAREILRELIAEPRLPGYLRRQAEDYLKGLGR